MCAMSKIFFVHNIPRHTSVLCPKFQFCLIERITPIDIFGFAIEFDSSSQRIRMRLHLVGAETAATCDLKNCSNIKGLLYTF